ncbi:MAG TPA: hypothetical protein VFK04_12975 [Gemmatimonadaceae bacterium]|nr:hypothetical protein [Gemmatimonadaceae bacterium]
MPEAHAVHDDVILLGGRRWRPAQETTARHDDWVMLQVIEADLETLSQTAPGADAAREILIRAIRSGKTYLLLAGMLVEEGRAWTPESATANAEFFANLTSMEDKQTLRAALVHRAILPFFLRGVAFSRTSQSSSPGDASRPTAPSKKKRGRKTGRASASPSGAT